MNEKELATDIRTAGELVEVLSKLPEHTPVKVMKWRLGIRSLPNCRCS